MLYKYKFGDVDAPVELSQFNQSMTVMLDRFWDAANDVSLQYKIITVTPAGCKPASDARTHRLPRNARIQYRLAHISLHKRWTHDVAYNCMSNFDIRNHKRYHAFTACELSQFVGRPFVKQFPLCYRTVACPVCLWRWCTVVKQLDGSRCHMVRR